MRRTRPYSAAVRDNNIRELRLGKGLTQVQLAALAKIDKGYVSKLERGIGVGALDMLARLADALGTSIEGLGNIPREGEAVPVPPATYRYPVRAIVRAGPVTEAVEIPESPIGWEPSLQPLEDGLEALEISGDSMSPALEHGDRIVVDSRATPEDGDMVLAEYHDPRRPDEQPELTVKMWMRQDGSALLVPLNSVYEARVFDRRWWRIRGVVVKCILRHARGRFRYLVEQKGPGPTG